MSTYEPGTVAVATVRGVPNVRVFRGEGFWQTAVEVGCNVRHYDGNGGVEDLRPLVVLDLGSTQPNEAVRLLREGDSNAGYETFLDSIADQIEAQTKPPRMAEPGLWGVVEAAHTLGAVRAEWVHDRNGLWKVIGGTHASTWADLVDPQPLHDGIEDGAL